MNLLPRLAAAVAAAALVAAPSATNAAVIFSLGQTTVNLDPGQQAAVPVYLEFTGADRATLLADGGLYSAAALLTRDTAGASSIATAAFGAPFGGGFSEIQFTGPAPHAAGSLYGEITNLNAGALGSDDGTTSRIQLGTFTLTAGPVAGQSDTFTLSVLEPNGAWIATNAVATALRDPATFDASVAPVTLAINVVPEPASATLAILAAAGLAPRRRR